MSSNMMARRSGLNRRSLDSNFPHRNPNTTRPASTSLSNLTPSNWRERRPTTSSASTSLSALSPSNWRERRLTTTGNEAMDSSFMAPVTTSATASATSRPLGSDNMPQTTSVGPAEMHSTSGTHYQYFVPTNPAARTQTTATLRPFGSDNMPQTTFAGPAEVNIAPATHDQFFLPASFLHANPTARAQTIPRGIPFGMQAQYPLPASVVNEILAPYLAAGYTMTELVPTSNNPAPEGFINFPAYGPGPALYEIDEADLSKRIDGLLYAREEASLPLTNVTACIQMIDVSSRGEAAQMGVIQSALMNGKQAYNHAALLLEDVRGAAGPGLDYMRQQLVRLVGFHQECIHHWEELEASLLSSAGSQGLLEKLGEEDRAAVLEGLMEG